MQTYPECKTAGCALYSTNGTGYCSQCNRHAHRHANDEVWNSGEYRKLHPSQTRCICGGVSYLYAADGWTFKYACEHGGTWGEYQGPAR